MELTILGSGSAFSEESHHAAYLLDRRLLLDCGAPVPVLLSRLGQNTAEAEGVLISHLHGDHSLQLPLLVGIRRINHPAAAPLRIVGPRGTAAFLEQTGHLSLGDFWSQVATPEALSVEEWAPGQEGELCSYQVRVVAVEHAASLECFAFKIEDQKLALGYSGDTTYCEGIRSLAGAVDYLLCECTNMSAPAPIHLWREEVEQLMREAPDTRFILTHLSERRPVPGAILASDGLVLDLQPRG